MGSIEKSRWVSCRLNSALKVGCSLDHDRLAVLSVHQRSPSINKGTSRTSVGLASRKLPFPDLRRLEREHISLARAGRFTGFTPSAAFDMLNALCPLHIC